MERKLTIKNDFQDIAAVIDLIPSRRRRITGAPATPAPADCAATLAAAIHPQKLHLLVDEVRSETATAKTFRLIADKAAGTCALPTFRAGQYLSFRLDIGGSHVTRPYSIASSPADARDRGYMEITVRRKDDGFVSAFLWENWSRGTAVETSGPCGFFCIDPLRDSRDIVALAGGCGITPFRSMMRDIAQNGSYTNFTLIYGVNTPEDIIYEKELKELENSAPDRIRAHVVCGTPGDSWCGPTGFLTEDTIRNLGGDPSGKTFFICGPQPMYLFLEREMKGFGLRLKQVRREVFGVAATPLALPGFPAELAGNTFSIKAVVAGKAFTVPAKADETVLVALERAGVAPPSQCRSGECGFCRALLVKGNVFVSPENDGRRAADKKFGFFHPCSSYPISDLEIDVPR